MLVIHWNTLHTPEGERGEREREGGREKGREGGREKGREGERERGRGREGERELQLYTRQRERGGCGLLGPVE